MHSLWNSEDREAILSRFERLSPEATPKWGKLDAPGMVTHVTDTLRSGSGDLAVAPKPGPLQYWPLNTLVMFYLPWPKSAPTAPELLKRKPADWRAEINTLRSVVTGFAAKDINGEFPVRAAFGRINGDQWGRLMYRHLDYHLGQFGG